MNFKRVIRVLVWTAVIASTPGCRNDDHSLASASDATPVRYVICDSGDKNCYVSARFRNMESCASHKEWADMLCDKQSRPGLMICKADTDANTSPAHCTL